MRGNRAVFLDRDGVLNDLVYDEEEGHAGSPFSASEMRVFPYVASTVRELREKLGYHVIVISNQPGVAKGQFSHKEFERMRKKLVKTLEKGGTAFDGEYYCLHHPQALDDRYRADCDCRKPKPGMLLKAAEEHDVDLSRSYFVGDSLVDVKAGRRAGCITILVGQVTTFLSRMMEQEDAAPDYMIPSLKDVPGLLLKLAPLEARRNQLG
jgi:D-glycero-D-manno-heptose 1,7-bisphosphate phosphatase